MSKIVGLVTLTKIFMKNRAGRISSHDIPSQYADSCLQITSIFNRFYYQQVSPH